MVDILAATRPLNLNWMAAIKWMPHTCERCVAPGAQYAGVRVITNEDEIQDRLHSLCETCKTMAREHEPIDLDWFFEESLEESLEEGNA